MCIKINQEDLITIHHELGHNYYYHYYYKLPMLYQNGAHDGFHEAIGDALALSVTPVPQADRPHHRGPDRREGLINLQMQDALDKIAFLPVRQADRPVALGRVQRQDHPRPVQRRLVGPARQVPGHRPAGDRKDPDFFDAGAKYHVPANVPYTRYFLARILQFQFHKALCAAAGHTGPLHECSIYGKTAAGDKLRPCSPWAPASRGPRPSRPITGTREMDAQPMIEYFEPTIKVVGRAEQGPHLRLVIPRSHNGGAHPRRTA
jgi:peptidyl-dipeptidase A